MKRQFLRSPFHGRCMWQHYAVFIMFLMMLASTTSMGQIAVKGKVIDESGAPLPGVNILVRGTTSGTNSDADGSFSINVNSQNDVLIFSFIGYESEEIVVGAQTQINVTLVPNMQALSEVIVIGYGTQRQEAVTGSVVSMKGDVLREIPTGNLTTALQGRMAGVELTQTSTKPGANMQIRIRGTRSITADNDPLVVLDGVPFVGNLADINPNDIKSVDILKDASATAIYGSRGANGVILVSTNRGNKNQKPTITYSAFVGAKKPFSRFPMMSGKDMAELRKLNIPYNSYGQDEAEDVNTDWQKYMYRTGTTTSHDIGIAGGTNGGNYNFGVGYHIDQAVVPTSQFQRYIIRGGIDQEIGKHVKIGFTTNSNYKTTEGNHIDMGGLLRFTPVANPFNDDGTWKRTIRTAIDEQFVYSRSIVEKLQDQWLNDSKDFSTYNSLYGELKVPGIEGLTYRTTVALDYIQSNNGSFTGEGIGSANALTESVASITKQNRIHWLIENMLTYDRTFGKHNINVVGMYSAEQSQFDRLRVVARDIPHEEFQYFNLGHANGEITVSPGDQGYEQWGLMSYMGRAMYSYDDRYMLTATLRSDGSSRLAPGHKWHTYPAVSAGWNIAQESFMRNISQINVLKIRLGYGITSNQAVAPYMTLGNLSTRPYNFGSEFATGYLVSRAPNPQLGWEFSKTTNVALDFTILNNRLSGTFEYYRTNTYDLLLDKELHPASGLGNVMENIGTSQNKGVEISLNGRVLDNHNGWTWDIGFNLYANRNEITSLRSGFKRNEGNWWFVGHPIDVIYDYKAIGLWQDGDPHREILEPGANTLGMIKVEYTGEYNDDGTPVRAIGPEDRQIMSMLPNFQGGFNTRVTYRNFDFTIVGAFKNGGILNSTLYGGGGYMNLLNGRNGNVDVDYWTPENTKAKYPNPESIRSGDNLKYANTMGYFDASYLKIRTMSLGYNFKKIGNTDARLRVYVTAQNPFVMFSPYHRESGMDPETNSYGNENAAVPMSYALRRVLTVGTNAPATRNYVLGVNFTF